MVGDSKGRLFQPSCGQADVLGGEVGGCLSLHFRRNLSKFRIVEFRVEAGEEQGSEEEYQSAGEAHGGDSGVRLDRSSCLYR